MKKYTSLSGNQIASLNKKGSTNPYIISCAVQAEHLYVLFLLSGKYTQIGIPVKEFVSTDHLKIISKGTELEIGEETRTAKWLLDKGQ